jgi:hypothetical protein
MLCVGRNPLLERKHMLFTPLRKAVIAGAGVLALGAAVGVSTHSGASLATLTATTATPGASPAASPDANQCRPHGPALGAAQQVLAIAAGATGLTEQQILDQLRTGKTLNQIAGSKAASIQQQAVDKLKAALDKRVAAGKLDAAREQTMLDQAKVALDKAMAADLSSKIPPAGAAPCPPRGLLGVVVKVTAEKTGLTEQAVLDQLNAGKSIDQIAGSKAADVKAAVLQQEQQKLSTELDTLMGRSGLPAPKFGQGRGHGGGGPFGPKGTASPTAAA